MAKMGLLGALRQYIGDAMPGGALNPEVTRQGLLDTAATSTAFIPGIGDALGLLADVNMYATDPAERTAGNFALTAAGLLPFVPAAASVRGADRIFDVGDIMSRPQVPQRTLSRYVPPRGTPERLLRLAQNEDAYKKILDYARSGMNEESLGWYNMMAFKKKLIEDLGEEAGTARFNRFIDFMGATSAGAKVPDNIRIASYYDILNEQGLGAVHPKNSPFGPGYGHKAQGLHNKSAARLMSGEPLDLFDNPKRVSFTENLKGNWAPTTVDKHNMRAWGMVSRDPEWLATTLSDERIPMPWWWDSKRFGKWDAKTFRPQDFYTKHATEVPWEELPNTWFKEAPERTEYLAFEELNNRLAKELGVDPAAAQAALWLGAGKLTGLGSPPQAAINVMEDVIGQRAVKRGVSKQQVWSDFVTGKMPLQFTGAGLLGAGGLRMFTGEDDQ